MDHNKTIQEKDHELGITVVCDYISKTEEVAEIEIMAVNNRLDQHPQIVAKIYGSLTFIAVKTVRYPNESTLDDLFATRFKEHASKSEAVPAFAPIGLWPTDHKNEDGEDGFHVKFEGLQYL